MEFISELIMDVMSIVNRSGNTNLELKIALDREASGLPNVKFELIPKAPVTNTIERLNRAYAQNAKFHEEMGVTSDTETAISFVEALGDPLNQHSTTSKKKTKKRIKARSTGVFTVKEEYCEDGSNK
ncbi:hypothetical protein KIN20_019602 [Parelaphostrongylus tenuis]|uniref:Uncharacterized protein n=1 Tax=Parelaphostrongylus tenuis TaxID=148309 RepID=A0AAD5N8W3_PARTN|nr:hypothetical protein KIN20_019602 [Parelaphostrongylus tenuis]